MRMISGRPLTLYKKITTKSISIVCNIFGIFLVQLIENNNEKMNKIQLKSHK